MVSLEKEKIRKKVLIERKNQVNDEIIKKNNKIKRKLCSLRGFNEAKIINCYLSKSNEVSTYRIIKDLLKNKKIVSVPYINQKKIKASRIYDISNLKKGPYGIYQPEIILPLKEKLIDVIIVPGIAFDKKMNRIGYGKGYYDKYLKKLKALKIGLCYDFQLFEKIPATKHDIKMDIIITEKRMIK